MGEKLKERVSRFETSFTDEVDLRYDFEFWISKLKLKKRYIFEDLGILTQDTKDTQIFKNLKDTQIFKNLNLQIT